MSIAVCDALILEVRFVTQDLGKTEMYFSERFSILKYRSLSKITEHFLS